MRKETKKFYFSVEGETEKYYLNYLCELVNKDLNAKYKLAIHVRVRKPLSYVKNLSTIEPVEIVHLNDYESHDTIHQNNFRLIMDDMIEAKREKSRVKDYVSGHTNLTFDLWIVLHKLELNSKFNHRSQYLSSINQGYNEKFMDMGAYKKEQNFKRILKKITIEDVRLAINRAITIEEINKSNGYIEQTYKGFRFYKENPSMQIHIVIKRMLDRVYT